MKQLKTICPHCNKEIILTQDKTNNIISENDLSEKKYRNYVRKHRYILGSGRERW